MAEQFALEEILGDRRAIQRDELLVGALAVAVDVAGEDFLARSGVARDQDAGVASGNPVGQSKHLRGARIGEDQRVGFLGHGLEDRSDEFGIGRQRDVFLGARLDGAHRRLGVGADTVGDDRNADALVLERFDESRDVEFHVDHDEIGALPRPREFKGGARVRRMADLGAMIEGDLAGRSNLTVHRSDDE